MSKEDKKSIWQRKTADIRRQHQFTNIYKDNLWGRGSGKYYSGSGSYREDLIIPYKEWLGDFISRENIQSIVDLGCGDFNVGGQLASLVPKYIGVDIVKGLIQDNKNRFGSSSVSFECLDIVADELPDGDVCLVRQVLQHLSNAEIIQVLNKLNKYKYSVITEMVYDKSKTNMYNADIKENRETRRSQKSGVYLEEAPFSREFEIVKILPYGKDENLVMSLLCGDNTKL